MISGVPSIRPAGPGDAGDVFALALELATSFTPERATFDRTYSELLGDDRCLVLVAEHGEGRIVGYLLAFVHPTFFANGPVGWIEELIVQPDARRSGTGRALVPPAEEWAAGHGVTLVALATRRAEDFWQAVGYEPSASYLRKLLAGSAAGEDLSG
jgi:GNAT superfamily N-acetyltransferase